MNHVCRVNRRLFNHRLGGVGKISDGNIIAKAMSGIPSSEGLRNWSKKFRLMVSFRGSVQLFEYFLW